MKSPRKVPRPTLGPLRPDVFTSVHTFGDDLIFHPHLHVLAADGLWFTNSPDKQEARSPKNRRQKKSWQSRPESYARTDYNSPPRNLLISRNPGLW